MNSSINTETNTSDRSANKSDSVIPLSEVPRLYRISGMPLTYEVAAILFIVGFFIMFGNALIITATIKSSRIKKKPVHYYIGHMALADLVVSLLVQSLSLYIVATKFGKKSFRINTCAAGNIGHVFWQTCSTTFMLLIGVDRAIFVTPAINYKSVMTRGRRDFAIVAVYGCGVISTAIMTLSYTVYHNTYPHEFLCDILLNMSKDPFRIILLLILPTLDLSISLFLTVYLFIQTRNMSYHETRSHGIIAILRGRVTSCVDLRLIQIVFYKTFINFISFTPHSILSIMYIFQPSSSSFSHYNIILIFILSAMLFQAAFSFVIYTWKHPDYTKMFKSLLCAKS